jgi:hypothetical protein
MVLLDKSTSNTFALTLSEKVTISNPYYLMVLVGKSGQDTIKWLMTDTSTYPERYNLFTFTDGNQATIPYKGDYVYTVYQKLENNTDIPSDSNILEIGICRVADTESPEIEHTNPSDVIIYEVNE